MLNDELIRKLDVFIRRFYKNLLLKGLLYSLALLVFVFLLLNLLEYFGYNGTGTRTFIFYSYIFLAAVLLVFFVLRPAVKMCKIGRRLSYDKAAEIIGSHFPQVSDKLLNLLQLKELSKTSDSQLLIASIEQRTKELSPIPFHKAIDKKKTKRGLAYSLFAVFFLLLTAMVFPSFLREPTYRYIYHNSHFEKPAPFVFELENKKMQVLQHDDFELKLKVYGEALPEVVNVNIEGKMFQMRKSDKNSFSYRIRQMQKTTRINFVAAGFESRDYIIEVNPKPILVSLEAVLEYPAYTKLKSKTITSLNSFSVPKGTKIVWHAQTKDTKRLVFNSGDKKMELVANDKGQASCSQRIMEDYSFLIQTQNEHTVYSDSLRFQIECMEDKYPQIAVIEQKDSIVADVLLFRGQIKDDYGFDKLEFHILRYKNGEEKVADKKIQNIMLNGQESAQEFYHYVQLSELGVEKGDRLEYYFQVWDNDGVNGHKSSKSSVFVFSAPTEKELDEKKEMNSEQIKSESEKTIKEIRELQKQIEEINRKLIEKKELQWEDKKQVEQLLDKQRELKQRVEQIRDKLKQNNEIEESFSKQEQEILEKQKELERLFNQVMDEQMRNMMEEIQKLSMEQIDKDKLNESLNRIKLNNEDLSKQLDRNMEMYKRFEVEKRANEIIDKLKELSERQKKLSEEIGKMEDRDIKKKQHNVNEEFRKQQEKLNKLQQQAKELETPQDINRDKQREENINEQQRQAEENIERNKNRKAKENMEESSEQMQQMAEDLQQQFEDNQQEQLAEDLEEVRQMLKNLIRLSKNQEELMNQTKRTKVSDPSYQTIIKQQYNIKEGMKLINDSLFAMSKRQPHVGSLINQELTKIGDHIDKALESVLKYNQVHYANYKNSSASSSQQYAMTSMNNLALMLSESIENMRKEQQQKSNSKGKSSSQCKNPSSSPSSKPSSQNMKGLQESLNKELERLRKELENQKNKEPQKIGEGAKLNEALAKAAAQQEMIRKLVQKAAEQAKKNEGKPSKLLNEILKQMEQTEKEIVNKTISRKTINRQAQILTRMLEYEKAEKKQGEDSKRESSTGEDKINKIEEEFLEFKKLQNRDEELFKQIPPVFSPFYDKKVTDYFYKFDN